MSGSRQAAAELRAGSRTEPGGNEAKVSHPRPWVRHPRCSRPEARCGSGICGSARTGHPSYPRVVRTSTDASRRRTLQGSWGNSCKLRQTPPQTADAARCGLGGQLQRPSCPTPRNPQSPLNSSAFNSRASLHATPQLPTPSHPFIEPAARAHRPTTRCRNVQPEPSTCALLQCRAFGFRAPTCHHGPTCSRGPAHPQGLACSRPLARQLHLARTAWYRLK